MTSRKRWGSVVQSLAHHATSSLCYLHPDLEIALRAAGVRETTIDLLGSASSHPLAPVGSPRARAIEAFRERFQKILAAEGFTLADVSDVKVRFRFNDRVESTSLVADARLVTADGTVVSRAVDYSGRVCGVEEF